MASIEKNCALIQIIFTRNTYHSVLLDIAVSAEIQFSFRHIPYSFVFSSQDDCQCKSEWNLDLNQMLNG